MMASVRNWALAAAIALGVATASSAQWSGAPASAPVAKQPPAASTAIPEPADFALFAAGVVGLLLGRRGSRSRPRDGE